MAILKKNELSPSPAQPMVLVVDDDRTIEKRIRYLIKLSVPEAEVVWAKSGMEAYNVLKSKILIPDLILLDIFMPGQLDGLGLLKKIPELKVTAPVVMISNLSLVSYHKVTRELSFMPPFLEKPLDELEAVVMFRGMLNK